MLRVVVVFAAVAALAAPGVTAEKIGVAAASNMRLAVTEIAKRFEASSGHEISLAFGSTGKHYAQIRNGAPFAVFLAADVERPARLEQEGVAITGSRFTYAVGKLVLWSPDPGLVDGDARVLERGGFRHLAVASAKLAPYGRAARQVLEARGLWERLSGRLVTGENIGQTFQFVASGNAELGFVALSQLRGVASAARRGAGGSLWLVPQELYTPIEQQAVLLKNSVRARAFLTFVQSEEARAILEEYGYDTP